MLTNPIVADVTHDFAADVRAGLTKPLQKELPSKYLYDTIGSKLFEAICELPEYGLTRADSRLLRRYANEIVRLVPGDITLCELGSGSGRKTRWILEALSRRRHTYYYPIEISREALSECCRELSDIAHVGIVGLEREYLDGLLEVAARRAPGQRIMVLFLGSTIGNFSPPADAAFLREIRMILQPGDALLLGADLQKPEAQLVAAYADAIGVTAAFNRNILSRINRELDADFDLAHFQHLARYNTTTQSIEMHLQSTVRQTATIRKSQLSVTFEEGETIWTENSHKYSLPEIGEIVSAAGFRCEQQWIDREWPFVENLFVVE